MLQMRKAGNPSQNLSISRALNNNDYLYIGTQKLRGQAPDDNLRHGNYAFLSKIVTLIGNSHTPSRVNWCACCEGFGWDAFYNGMMNPHP